MTDSRVIGEVNDLKGAGGDVTVATGGAIGSYLENTCGSSAALLAAYKKALDAVGGNRLDVDVEASIPVAQVNTALKQLQSERGTAVTYTLRVQSSDYGVAPFSVQVLQDAASRGLNVTVNPMLTDFGYSGSWGDALIAAANSTLGQMRQVWPEPGPECRSWQGECSRRRPELRPGGQPSTRELRFGRLRGVETA